VSKYILLSFCLTLSYFSYAEKVVEMDPNDIDMGGLIHESLPESLLKRIKYLSDTFEIVDGISYEESVDLYKRDLNPEANIVIYEEMARVYNKFCENRCLDQEERMDVYRLVLLRSMYSSEEAINKVNLSKVSKSEAIKILANYKLKEEPIAVYEN
jgi:hypothetical protein